MVEPVVRTTISNIWSFSFPTSLPAPVSFHFGDERSDGDEITSWSSLKLYFPHGSELLSNICLPFVYLSMRTVSLIHQFIHQLDDRVLCYLMFTGFFLCTLDSNPSGIGCQQRLFSILKKISSFWWLS